MPPPEPDARLDCRGLYCPEPVIRTTERVREMAPGEVLEVVGTDPGLAIDIPAYCIGHGHKFLGSEWRDGEIVCVLEVLGGDPGP
jgi:tRNA 2-thiouridine synthesizing protein A